MSIEKEVKQNGVTVWWSLSDGTNVNLLREGFEAIKKSHLIPEVSENSQALRRALKTHFRGRDVLIRPIRGVCGFAVVREDDSGKEMEYEEELRIMVTNLTGGHFSQFSENMRNQFASNPQEHPLRDAIKESYLFEKNLIPAASLGKILVQACRELNGIPLRPRGGMYWIPKSSIEDWEKIVAVVESANRGNTTWKMRTSTDAESIQAICDSLIIQVENQLDNLEEELEHGSLGKRALETREREAKALDDLCKTYEGILSVTLDGLRGRVTSVETAACNAILDAMAG